MCLRWSYGFQNEAHITDMSCGVSKINGFACVSIPWFGLSMLQPHKPSFKESLPESYQLSWLDLKYNITHPYSNIHCLYLLESYCSPLLKSCWSIFAEFLLPIFTKTKWVQFNMIKDVFASRLCLLYSLTCLLSRKRLQKYGYLKVIIVSGNLNS